jgi:hypothetical protein
MALTQIIRSNTDELSISKIEYIATADIDSALFELFDQNGLFTGALGNSTTPYVLPADWKDRTLSTNASDTNQGPLREYSVNCRLSSKGHTIEDALATMMRYRYVLRLTLDTGAKLQFGTPDYPAKFSYSKPYGDSQPNVYAITFNCKTPDKLLYL